MTDLEALEAQLIRWRHDLHRHPEFGFEETRTSAFVAEKLRGFGLEVETGIGGTGVVGTLRLGQSNRSIALRADMDALRITESTGLPYASQNEGVMHACGHDGHTVMLLGAAQILANDGGFDGTIQFIFQPAEEWGQGALAMLKDGLNPRFPFDEVYGLHNMPGIPVGHVHTRSGPMMSAEDIFEITLKGVGGHAARPHTGQEVMVPACDLVMSLQTIVSRRLDPTKPAVVSVTEIITDGTRNVLPGEARILGDARSFDRSVSRQIEEDMQRIVQGIAEKYGIEGQLSYSREFVALENDPSATDVMVSAAQTVSSQVDGQADPITASEDFAQFLNFVPGCFAFIGNGEESAPLHSPNFDFNDKALLHGTQVHVAVARARLPVN